jgi:retron-type reverse transcriptase
LAHKSAALQLSKYLYKNVAGFPHANAFGYIPGKSTRDNAQRHVGAKWIVSADIENFFPSITRGIVEKAFISAGMNNKGAAIIARFLTIDGKLAPGINSSPLIANLVALPLDIELTKLCEAKDIVYTRYADDMTFSAKGDATALLEDFEIDNILRKHGFRLNKKKFRTSKRGQKHYVTGLSVADEDRPHAPKKLKRRLRQEMYYISKHGLRSHLSHVRGQGEQQTVNRIDGMVNYIASIETKLSKNLREQWKNISKAQGLRRSYVPRPYDVIRAARWFVDETELRDAAGNEYLALVCVETDNSDYIDNVIRKFSVTASEDVFLSSARAKKLREHGPHWAELNQTQKEKVVDLLSVVECRCVIALDKKSSQATYEQTYLSLLELIADQMMRSLDDATLHVYVEQNKSKVSSKKVEASLQSIYSKLTEANQRRPVVKPTISLIRKGESYLLSVADVLAGVFRDYAQFDGSTQNEAVKFLRFQRLDSRFKIIFDVARKKVFTRKHSFIPWSQQDAGGEHFSPLSHE